MKNKFTSGYYWRAVRRIAKRRGISITAARKTNWKREATAERKRRSVVHISPAPKRKPPKRPPVSRALPPKRKRKSVSDFPPPKLPIREYERMHVRDEEELEDEEEATAEWETDWEQDYSELDDLDNLEDFLDSFEYEDSDKYKEPS